MIFFRRKRTDSVSARELVSSLAIAATGALGLLVPGEPSETGRVIVLLGWLALLAPAAGAFVAARGTALWPLALVAPAVWMALVGVIDASSLHGLPTPAWAGVAWTGLYLSGFGIGCVQSGRPFAYAGALLFLATSLFALSGAFGFRVAGGGHELAAWLLDLSPVTLVVECAGIDWMRHPAIYDVAGDIPPDVRTAYRGILAGPCVLLVGLTFAIFGARRRRAVAERAE